MDSAALAIVGTQFEGLLFELVLAPLESSLGELGNLPIASFAQALASRDLHGFAAVLKRLGPDGR